MTYPFEKDHIGRMILVHIQLDSKHTFRMMLDTGASMKCNRS